MLKGKLRKNPFDFYVAFVLFIFGAWGIVDPNWPEKYLSGVLLTIVTIIGEMYGWLFISAAALAISIIYGISFYDSLDSLWLLGVWTITWAGMAVAAGLRSLDLFIFYRSL